MKKIYFALFIVSVFYLNAGAQTIPNNGFETWVTYPGTSIEDPIKWQSSNLVYDGLAQGLQVEEQTALDAFSPGAVITETVPPSVVKVPGHTGTYAVKVQNVVMTSTTTYPAAPTTTSDSPPFPGFVEVYSISGVDTAEGIPVSSSPVALTGFYKFNQGSTTSLLDTGSVVVYLQKWNTGTLESDSIGYGEILFKTSVSTFTAFTVNIVNTSGLVPDTAIVGMLSSQTQANTNTYLIVDDLAFTGATGITPIFSNISGITLYPNPAKDQITIKNLPVNAGEVQIMDYMGRRVANVSALGNEVNFNTSSFASGLYFYNVLDNRGGMLYSSRFTVAN